MDRHGNAAIQAIQTALTVSLATASMPAANLDGPLVANSGGDHHARAERLLGPDPAGHIVTSFSPKGLPTVAVDMGPNQPGSINGKHLPPNFKIGPHTNGVVFSENLEQYAYTGVTNGHLQTVVGKVPKSGIVETDAGVRIDVSGGVTSDPRDQVKTFPLPHHQTLGTQPTHEKPAFSKHLPSENRLTGEATQFFENITKVEINSGSSVMLGRVDGTRVEVNGSGSPSERAVVEGGVLKLNYFGGVVNLPAGVKEIKVHLNHGNVTGIVSAPGEISTGMGEVVIHTLESARLAFECKTGNGHIVIPRTKMLGEGHYEPLSGEPAGTLKISTDFGKIQVRILEDTGVSR